MMGFIDLWSWPAWSKSNDSNIVTWLFGSELIPIGYEVSRLYSTKYASSAFISSHVLSGPPLQESWTPAFWQSPSNPVLILGLGVNPCVINGIVCPGRDTQGWPVLLLLFFVVHCHSTTPQAGVIAIPGCTDTGSLRFDDAPALGHCLPQTPQQCPGQDHCHLFLPPWLQRFPISHFYAVENEKD